MKTPRTALRIGAIVSSLVIVCVYVGAQARKGGEQPSHLETRAAETQPGSQPSTQPNPRDPSVFPGSKSAGVFKPESDQALPPGPQRPE
jgi:hypothetical protein